MEIAKFPTAWASSIVFEKPESIERFGNTFSSEKVHFRIHFLASRYNNLSDRGGYGETIGNFLSGLRKHIVTPKRLEVGKFRNSEMVGNPEISHMSERRRSFVSAKLPKFRKPKILARLGRLLSLRKTQKRQKFGNFQNPPDLES